MHCQKKPSKPPRRQRPSDRSTQGQPAEPVSKGRGRLRHGHAPVRRPDVDAKRRNRHEIRAIAGVDATPAVTGTEWEPYVAAVNSG